MQRNQVSEIWDFWKHWKKQKNGRYTVHNLNKFSIFEKPRWKRFCFTPLRIWLFCKKMRFWSISMKKVKISREIVVRNWISIMPSISILLGKKGRLFYNKIKIHCYGSVIWRYPDVIEFSFTLQYISRNMIV